MRCAEFETYGESLPQGSKTPRLARGRIILTEGSGDKPRRHRAWREAVSDAARLWQAQNRQPLFQGACTVEVKFFITPPQYALKLFKRGIITYPSKKPDVDKLQRSIFDSLSKIILADDAQICDVLARKRYAFTCPPHCRIAVVEGILDEHEFRISSLRANIAASAMLS